ncbi:hypothetical protein BN126370054 [Stenotrophomonas indicatrix]|nr:hypothetical protein BN126370054 [Stenotrophomonas indicatrix]
MHYGMNSIIFKVHSMERETGIEPAPSAWKAEVLPLNYSRTGNVPQREAGGGRWIRTTEGVSQQIYSLPPLAAWVSLLTTPFRAAEALRCVVVSPQFWR